MTTTIYRFVDLPSFTGVVGVPTGSEIAAISQGGTGSYQIPLAILAQSRQPNTVNVGGTYNLAGLNFGDVLVTTTSAVTVQLPAAATRFGACASIVAQQTTTPNITILPFGSETIMGLASLIIGNPFGFFTLWPLAGGGWYQK
jgi:hypothetical protein